MKAKMIAIKNAFGLLKMEPSIEAISENFQKIAHKSISLTIKKIKEKI